MLSRQNNLQRHTNCWDTMKGLYTGKNKHQIVYFSTDTVRFSHSLSLSPPKRRHTWTCARTLHTPLAISLPVTLVPSHSLTVNCINILLSALVGFRHWPALTRDTQVGREQLKKERKNINQVEKLYWTEEDKQLHPCKISWTRRSSTQSDPPQCGSRRLSSVCPA